jgi:putative ATP-binding cassette transporter
MKLLRLTSLIPTFERVGGFDAIEDWANLLSTGEQQRISMVRLLLHKPKFVFLDEASTALDRVDERVMYSLIKESATTIISVGHRSSLEPFHDLALELDGAGGYKIHSLTKEVSR